MTKMAHMRNAAAKLRGEDGVAAVEFAIISTVLFLLVFGIIQFGLALSKIETFENAARHGGREAAVAPSTGKTAGGIRDDVVAAADPYGITGGRSAISIKVNNGSSLGDGTVPCSTSATGSNDQVKVSWSQSIQISIPFMPNLNVTHGIQATFRCEPSSG